MKSHTIRATNAPTRCKIHVIPAVAHGSGLGMGTGYGKKQLIAFFGNPGRRLELVVFQNSQPVFIPFNFFLF